MTANAHDSTQHDSHAGAGLARGERPAMETASRPRWLMPGVAVVLVAGGLVAAGVLSLSTVLTLGLFGGMMFMHLGGHGMHGGHGGGGGHGGHDDRTSDANALDRDRDARDDVAPDGEADANHEGRKMAGDGQRSTHGCH